MVITFFAEAHRQMGGTALRLTNVVLMLSLSACGGGGGDSDEEIVEGQLQIVNMIIDAPALKVVVQLDGDNVSTHDAVAYRGATSVATHEQDSYELSASYEDPDTGGSVTLIDDFTFSVGSESLTTLVLEGTMSAARVRTIERGSDPFEDDDEEQIEVLSYNLGGETVELYLGSPSSVPDASSPLETLASGNVSQPKLIDHLSSFRMMSRREAGAIVYDSSAFEIPVRSSRLVLLQEGTGADPDTFSATMTTSSGTVAFSNKVAAARLRLINLVPTADEFEISANSPSTGTEIQSAVLSYRQSTESVTAEPGFIRVTASPASGSTSLTSTLSIAEDTLYSVVLGGMADSQVLAALSAPARPVATQTAIQFINGLEETSDEDSNRVDFYALKPTDRFSDTSPIARQIGFMKSASVYVPATALDLVVTTSGTQTILAGPIRLDTQGDSTGKVVAVSPSDSGGTPNEITVYDNTIE